MHFADQPFHTQYRVASGDTVVNIANRRGFPNAGPLVAYPPNRELFRRKFGANFLTQSRDFAVASGDYLFVPWREEALQNLALVYEKQISSLREDTQKIIQGLMQDREELESFLTRLDIMAVASGAVAGTFAAAGVFAAELNGVESVFLKKVLTKGPVGDFLLGRFLNVGGVIADATDAPSSNRKKWDWLRLTVRHTLNVTSPSYWASIATVIFVEHDVDIWWSGPGHIAENKAREITARAQHDIRDLQNGLTAARRQLALPFYRHRI